MYDVWETKNGSSISMDGNGSRAINVAIYCRVSTEHDEQVKALDNQIHWVNDQLKYHPNWRLVKSCCSSRSKKNRNKSELKTIPGFYIDEGLSGLTTNRPAFTQIVGDAKSGKIDLIITREVCRFSRNILDTIAITRELKSREYGVAIDFISDSLFTYDNDAEFRLAIFASMAQNESLKISERVRAGQKTSRDKKVLYGNGNIMGYDLIKQVGSNRYEINPEQAETVKRIFELCKEGNGVSKISHILVTENRKNASGDIKWTTSNILRILQNKVYCGYISYNVSKTDEVLNKKRRSINKSERIYTKVSEDIIPPIIDEDLWQICQRSLAKNLPENFQSKKKCGKKTAAKDVYAKKLRCSCGHTFRKNIWYRGKHGNTYGYTCYNVLNNGRSTHYDDGETADSLNMCNMPAISELKIKIQAQKIFSSLLESQELAEDVIEAKKKSKTKNDNGIQREINTAIKTVDKLRERNKRYINLHADGDISREEYLTLKKENEDNIRQLETKIESLKEKINDRKDPEIDTEQIKKILNTILDCRYDVSPDLIDKFVYQITVESPTHFIWKLHFKPIYSDNPEFVPVCQYIIDEEYAKEYAKNHHQVIHKSSWQDITVDVQIAV